MWNGAKFGLFWLKTLAGFVVTAKNRVTSLPGPRKMMRRVLITSGRDIVSPTIG